jgi:hypothetical protein
MTIDTSGWRAQTLHHREEAARMRRRIFDRAVVLLALPLVVLGGCATAPSERTSADVAAFGRVQVAARTQSRQQLDAALEKRILALDPERISEADVRTTLTSAPAPRIVLVHGGVVGVYLLMESFAKFLVGMGYPEAKIRNPHDGAYSPASWPGTTSATRCGRC